MATRPSWLPAPAPAAAPTTATPVPEPDWANLPAVPSDARLERESGRRRERETRERIETTEAALAKRQAFKDSLPKGMDAGLWVELPPEPDDPILEGLFERGDKALIVGASKARKTFFALQMAVSLAAGKPFLNLATPKPRKVLYLNFEIREKHFHRRLIRTCGRLGLGRQNLHGWLTVLNLRGCGVNVDNLTDAIDDHDFDAVFIDPLYKLYPPGTDENAAGDMADLLRVFDEISEWSGAATVICHHDPKTRNQRTVSRGAGSGVLGRDYDAALYIDPHFDEKDAIVVESVARNYPPRDLFCAMFFAGAFDLAPQLATVAEGDQAAGKPGRLDLRDVADEVAAAFGTEPRNLAEVKMEIQKKYGLSDHLIRDVMDLLSARGFTRSGGYRGHPGIVTPPTPDETESLAKVGGQPIANLSDEEFFKVGKGCANLSANLSGN